jgi:hypothetical protein
MLPSEMRLVSVYRWKEKRWRREAVVGAGDAIVRFGGYMEIHCICLLSVHQLLKDGMSLLALTS